LKISDQIHKIIKNRESAYITGEKKVNLLNPPKAIWAVGVGSLVKLLKKVKEISLLPERQISKVKHLIGSRTSKFFVQKPQSFDEVIKNNKDIEKISDKEAGM